MISDGDVARPTAELAREDRGSSTAGRAHRRAGGRARTEGRAGELSLQRARQVPVGGAAPQRHLHRRRGDRSRDPGGPGRGRREPGSVSGAWRRPAQAAGHLGRAGGYPAPRRPATIARPRRKNSGVSVLSAPAPQLSRTFRSVLPFCRAHRCDQPTRTDRTTRSTQPCIPPGGNVTSSGWQVTLCDPMWHVSSRSGVATLQTAIHLLLTYLLTYSAICSKGPHLCYACEACCCSQSSAVVSVC